MQIVYTQKMDERMRDGKMERRDGEEDIQINTFSLV